METYVPQYKCQSYQTQTHTRELLSLLLLDSPKTYDGPAWRSLNDEVRAVLCTPRTRTRIPAHAHAHTHAYAHLQLVQAQTMLGGGLSLQTLSSEERLTRSIPDSPVACVHDGVKRLQMRHHS